MPHDIIIYTRLSQLTLLKFINNCPITLFLNKNIKVFTYRDQVTDIPWIFKIINGTIIKIIGKHRAIKGLNML